LLVLLPEQSLEKRLFSFLRPADRKQTRGCIQCLLQRVGLLIERTFQIADEIQPPIDEVRLGIVSAMGLRRGPFAFRTLPEVIEPRLARAVRDPQTVDTGRILTGCTG